MTHKPATAEAINTYLEVANNRAARQSAEFRRRDALEDKPDPIERPPVTVEPIPEAYRLYHPDGTWCARGWPCPGPHLRGRPGEPEPVPVLPSVAERVGQPTDPTDTPDGLYLQTVYAVGVFVMERDGDGTVREVVGPFVSGERARAIIDGMRVEREWRGVRWRSVGKRSTRVVVTGGD